MTDATSDTAPGTPLARGSVAEIRNLSHGRVLKLYRAHIPHAQIAAETAALERAAAAGLPVPEVKGTASYGDRSGVTMARLDGRTALERLRRRPFALPRLLARAAALQARIHTLAGDGMPSRRDAVRAAIERADLPPDLHESVMRRLAEAPAGHALCHGDFHLGNLIEHAGRLYAIDWDKAACDDPAADVARTLVNLRHGKLAGAAETRLADPVRALIAAAYLRAYARRSPDPEIVRRVRQWLPVATAAKAAFVPARRRPALNARIRQLLR